MQSPTVARDFDPKSSSFDLWNADVNQLRQRIQSLQNTPVSHEAVEAFFREELSKIQAQFPEYASLEIKACRHIYKMGAPSDFTVGWVVYLNDGGYVGGFGTRQDVRFAEILGALENVKKERDPKVIAARLRDQAAELTRRANEVEGAST